MKTRTPVSCRTRLPQGTCDDSPRWNRTRTMELLQLHQRNGRRKLVSLCRAVGGPSVLRALCKALGPLIKCNLVSLIAHRYVDRVMTESGCDGGGMDYGNACRSNTAFAQRRAARTPQQVARAHGKLTQWVPFFVAWSVSQMQPQTASGLMSVC